MNYKLSNIARSCISYDHNIYNIIYFPNRSITDSIIGSIENIRVIPPNSYWTNDIQAIIYNQEDTNLYNKQELIRYYQCPIFEISQNTQPNLENVYPIEFDLKQYFNSNCEAYFETKKEKVLAYIMDDESAKPNMVLDFLKKTDLEFAIIDSNQFLQLNTVELGKVLSQFKLILNNSNINNLLFSYLVGCTPITFRRDFAQSYDNIIQLVTDTDFIRTISNLVSKQNKQKIGQLEIQEFSNNIHNSITNLIHNFIIL